MAEKLNSQRATFTKETKLLINYLWENFRENLQWRHVRLGALPTKMQAKMFSVVLRWVDAIVEKDGKIIIIETKLRPTPNAIGQLLHYKELFKVTPEFKAFRNRPIELQFVTQFPDVALVATAQKNGVEYIVWPPLTAGELKLTGS